MDKEKAQQYRTSLAQTLFLTPNRQDRLTLLAAYRQMTSYREARNSVHQSVFKEEVTRIEQRPTNLQAETSLNLLLQKPESNIESIQLVLFEGRERDVSLENGVQARATPFVEVSRFSAFEYIGDDLDMTSVTLRAKLSQKVGRRYVLEGRISALHVDVMLWFRAIEMINRLKDFGEGDMRTAYQLAADKTVGQLEREIRATKHFNLFGGKPRKINQREADREIAKNADFIERMGGQGARAEVLLTVPENLEEIIRNLLEKGIIIEIKSVESELIKGTISDSPMLQQLLEAARQAELERYERFAKVREYRAAWGKKDQA